VRGRVTRLAAMPGRLLGFAVALILAASVAGCGGDDGGGPQIPQEDADAMLATAGQIEAATASEECEEAQAATNELRGQVDAVEGEVDVEIYDALSQMVSRLDEELDAECVDTGPTATEEPEESEPVPPPTTTSAPPETTTTTTTTAPEEDDEEAPPQQPPGEDDGSQGPPPVSPPGQSGGAPPTGGTEGGDA
jgi:hypothetical protein